MSDLGFPISFSSKVPPGEDRERRVCDSCGFIDYVNPRIVTGVVAHAGDRILLCRRAIEPRKGFWTLPAGFLELGESVEDGAKREAREEANAELEIEAMLGLYSIPRIGQVQIFFRARLLNDPSPGVESLEVGLFTWDDVPWKELAFPTVRWALDHYRQTAGQAAFSAFGNRMEPTISHADATRDGPAILATLEAVAERHGDPTAAIYAELFAAHPELEKLFWLDRDGSVRAAMVQQGLECILDQVGEGRTAATILADERSRHDGYGVPRERFDDFMIAMRDAFRRIMGDDWTGEMEGAWERLLTEFAAIR